MSLTYAERAQVALHPLARHLFLLMEKKKTNLGLAADVTRQDQLLQMAQDLGPYICVFKTHIDIVEDLQLTFRKLKSSPDAEAIGRLCKNILTVPQLTLALEKLICL